MPFSVMLAVGMEAIRWQIFLSLCAANCMATLSEPEMEIAKALIRHFDAEHCLLLQPDGLRPFGREDVLMFSDLFVPVNILDSYEFVRYVRVAPKPYAKSLAVTRAADLSIFNFTESVYKKLYLFTWVVFLIENNSLTTRFDSTPFNAEIIVVQSINFSHYKLTETYGIYELSFANPFGTWNNVQGLRVSKLNIYERRPDLKGVRLKYGYGKNTAKRFTMGSFIKEIVLELSKMLKFSEGRKKRPKQQSADIYIGLMPLVPFDYHHDSIKTVFKISYQLYVKQPEREGESDFFVRPFSLSLWFSIGAWVVTTTFMLVLTRIGKQNSFLRDTLFAIFETLCNQEGDSISEDFKHRTIMITTRFLALFLIPSYGAFLLAFLAVRTPQIPFADIQGVFQDGSYQLIAIRGSKKDFLYKYFENTNDPLVWSAGKNLFLDWEKQPTGYYSAFEKVCNESVVFIAVKQHIYELLTRWKPSCQIYAIEKPFMTLHTIIKLSFMSEFGEIFNVKMIRMHSAGIIRRMQSVMDRRTPTYVFSDEFEPVELSHITYLIFLISGACVLSVWIFLQERLASCVGKRRGKLFTSS